MNLKATQKWPLHYGEGTERTRCFTGMQFRQNKVMLRFQPALTTAFLNDTWYHHPHPDTSSPQRHWTSACVGERGLWDVGGAECCYRGVRVKTGGGGDQTPGLQHLRPPASRHIQLSPSVSTLLGVWQSEWTSQTDLVVQKLYSWGLFKVTEIRKRK